MGRRTQGVGSRSQNSQMSEGKDCACFRASESRVSIESPAVGDGSEKRDLPFSRAVSNSTQAIDSWTPKKTQVPELYNRTSRQAHRLSMRTIARIR
jgi:hypothetical protein